MVTGKYITDAGSQISSPKFIYASVTRMRSIQCIPDVPVCVCVRLPILFWQQCVYTNFLLWLLLFPFDIVSGRGRFILSSNSSYFIVAIKNTPAIYVYDIILFLYDLFFSCVHFFQGYYWFSFLKHMLITFHMTFILQKRKGQTHTV